VRAALGEASARGAAVLFASEDLDELFAVCDRLVVLREGRIAGTFMPDAFRAETVGPAMVGVAAAA
jgi:general nucleoside transport system ATP-binding protein